MQGCNEHDCTNPATGYVVTNGFKFYLCQNHGPHRMGFVYLDDPKPTLHSELMADLNKLDQPTRSSVIAEADKIINGERQQVYGGAKESFGRIADFWTSAGFAKLAPSLDPSEPPQYRAITANDAAIALLLLKVSRATGSPEHRDSYVDMIGYAALAAELGIED